MKPTSSSLLGSRARILLLSVQLLIIFFLAVSIIRATGHNPEIAPSLPPAQRPSGGDFELLASTLGGGDFGSGGDFTHVGVIGEGYGARLSGGTFTLYSGFQPEVSGINLDELYLPLLIKGFSNGSD